MLLEEVTRILVEVSEVDLENCSYGVLPTNTSLISPVRTKSIVGGGRDGLRNIELHSMIVNPADGEMGRWGDGGKGKVLL